MDSKLVLRSSRLVFAYMVSIVLLASAIIGSYIVLREEMATQRSLSDVNTHINVIHRTINESVSLIRDYREAVGAAQVNPRLVQVIQRRANTVIDELGSRSALLERTMGDLEKTAHWDDFKWIGSTSDDGLIGLLDRFVVQVRDLVNRSEESSHQRIRPEMPAEAAGARRGALSVKFKTASDQLPRIIERHSTRVEAVHKSLTFLVLAMFLLLSLLIVLPLWRSLIREHEKRELAHEKLYHFAYTDSETGLPNLDGLERHIIQKANASQLLAGQFLLLVRLKNLDEIFNLIGSQEMTGFHQLFCERFQSSVIGKQNWSRSSEAEYATVISSNRFNESIDWLDQFIDNLSEPVKIAEILVRPSIALAASQLVNPDSDGGYKLCEHQTNARMALPLFERSMRNIPVYTLELTCDLAQQNELITAIRDGIHNKEFVPFYQIKVDAGSGAHRSMEVLCRWLRADGSITGPGKFIPAAERSGQIVPMTYQLLEQVVCDVKKWRAAGFYVGPLAINVSSDVLHHKAFIRQIRQARKELLELGSDLEIEVTENVVIEDRLGITRNVLEQLSAQGVQIAIDDFGIGYASLQTLLDLPFDVLKIDRSFVTPMSENGDGAEVLSAMISLCSKLEKQSVVEGVEFEWQWLQLARLGADELQGFFFHHPAKADDIQAWFESEQVWRAAS